MLVPVHPSPSLWSQGCWGGLVGQGQPWSLGHGPSTSSVLCVGPPLLPWCWYFQGRDGCQEAVTPAHPEHLWARREVRQGLGCSQVQTGWPGTCSPETRRCESWAGKSVLLGPLPVHEGLCPLGTGGGRVLGRVPGTMGRVQLGQRPSPWAELAQGK